MARAVQVHGEGERQLSAEDQAPIPALWKTTTAIQDLAPNSHADKMRSRRRSTCTVVEGSPLPSPLPSSCTRCASLEPPPQPFGSRARATPFCPPASSSWATHATWSSVLPSESLIPAYAGPPSHPSYLPWHPLGAWHPAVSAVIPAVEQGTGGMAGTPVLTCCTWSKEGSIAR